MHAACHRREGLETNRVLEINNLSGEWEPPTWGCAEDCSVVSKTGVSLGNRGEQPLNSGGNSQDQYGDVVRAPAFERQVD
jgi:hypothetical protein